MTPTDPRHGTEAGYSAHTRAGQDRCEACKAAKRRSDKRRRVFGPALVRIPADARRILERYGDRTIERRTGISACALQNMRQSGEAARVHPNTVARLRTMRVPTNVGVVRRIQALARLGWSAPEIAARTNDVPYSTVVRLREHTERRYVGREHIRDQIAAAYDELSMSIPPLTRHSSRIARRAERMGWAPPLAWDDIDNDPEPHGIRTRSDQRDLLTEWAELQEAGESIDQVALRFGVTVSAIEKAGERASSRCA